MCHVILRRFWLGLQHQGDRDREAGHQLIVILGVVDDVLEILE
jgi:hypothetical protein